MSRHFFEPYTFDERQGDDKYFYQNSLTTWQKNNPHRVRINSDTDSEIGNAISFIGTSSSTPDAIWTLSDAVGSLKLNFKLNTEWKQNCLLPLQVRMFLC